MVVANKLASQKISSKNKEKVASNSKKTNEMAY